MADAGCSILLTPPGVSAIAVVRLAGPDVGSFLERAFSRHAIPGRAVHGTLIAFDQPGRPVIDDPLVVAVSAEVVDLSLHGGEWVVREVFELAERNGFRRVLFDSDRSIPNVAVDTPSADAGEQLSGDAVVWREVLADLHRAPTEVAVRMLLAQPALWASLANGLTAHRARAVLSDRTMERLLSPPAVAIVGPANVGKSTLANRLFGRQRAITADLPGTTRDWVGGTALIGGVAVTLIDTPGLRATDDPIERAAIGVAERQIRAAELVVLVLDGSQPLGHAESELADRFPDAIVVASKSDLPMSWDRPVGRTTEVVRISVVAGTGIERLERALLDRLGCQDLHVPRPLCWTDRQRAWLGGTQAP